MNTLRLLTVDLNEGHRGDFKLFVNDGIRGNITDVITRLQEKQKPGDCIFDLCTLRGIRGEFAILRTSHRDADNNQVRDILNENSGIIRVRLGEIFSFKIFDGPFIRVWVTFENNNPKVSWSLLNSGKIDPGLTRRLEHSVRIREGKMPGGRTEIQPHSLEKAFLSKENHEEWSPSQPTTTLHVVESEEVKGVKGRKTPKAPRPKKGPKITDLPKTGTEQ